MFYYELCSHKTSQCYKDGCAQCLKKLEIEMHILSMCFRNEKKYYVECAYKCLYYQYIRKNQYRKFRETVPLRSLN